tara:strand:+ start:566 stop:718 length:153 start_codon:yes stop_codon:yes gene_type:complete
MELRTGDIVKHRWAGEFGIILDEGEERGTFHVLWCNGIRKIIYRFALVKV